jgi:hypothetical protein
VPPIDQIEEPTLGFTGVSLEAQAMVRKRKLDRRAFEFFIL